VKKLRILMSSSKTLPRGLQEYFAMDTGLESN
jgi:hypothetical protein